MNARAYAALCWERYRCHWKMMTLPLLAVLLFSFFLRIDVNYTDSLPHHAYLTVKGWKTELRRGDYVAYRFPSENPVSPYRKGTHMVKIVGGIAGDEVSMDAGGGFSIVRAGEESDPMVRAFGGQGMGIAKKTAQRGHTLYPGPVGIIPKGSLYVFSPHDDSLDSRYSMVGWIREENIIGRAFPLF